MRRRYKVGRIKRLRTYSVGDIADTVGVHPHTVRLWLAAGLPATDGQRPTLVRGEDLRTFLEGQRAIRKRPCPPATIYCVGCREPKRPAGDMAELIQISASAGNLRAICPTCERFMHRRVNVANLSIVCPGIAVTVAQA